MEFIKSCNQNQRLAQLAIFVACKAPGRGLHNALRASGNPTETTTTTTQWPSPLHRIASISWRIQPVRLLGLRPQFVVSTVPSSKVWINCIYQPRLRGDLEFLSAIACLVPCRSGEKRVLPLDMRTLSSLLFLKQPRCTSQ